MGSHGSLLIFLTMRALYFLSLHRETNPRGISTFLFPLWFGACEVSTPPLSCTPGSLLSNHIWQYWKTDRDTEGGRGLGQTRTLHHRKERVVLADLLIFKREARTPFFLFQKSENALQLKHLTVHFKQPARSS